MVFFKNLKIDIKGLKELLTTEMDENHIYGKI